MVGLKNGRRAGLLASLLVWGACDPDLKVGIRHDPPTVAIVTPSSGSEFQEGELVDFTATVATTDGTDLTDLTSVWVAGQDVICPEIPVSSDGFATCSWSFIGPGPITVELRVTDLQSDVGTDTVDLVINGNAPPEIVINEPQPDLVFPPGELVNLDATVSDLEDSAEDLAITVSSSLDGLLGDHGASSDGRWIASVELTKGEHLLTFRVDDLAGKSAQESVIVRIDSPPSQPEARMLPENPVTGDGLSVTVETDSVDPDGDIVFYEYEWYVSGVDYPNPTFPTTNALLSNGVTVRGEVWEALVYANDGIARSIPAVASVTIGNVVPSISTCDIAPITPSTEDVLLVITTGWTDPEGDAERLEYRWLKADSASWIDLAETGDTLGATVTTRGDTIKVQCTPVDSFGRGTTIESAPVTILNTAPTVAGCVLSPVDPLVTHNIVVSATGGADDDGDAVTFEYTWFVDGLEVSRGVDASLAAGSATRGQQVMATCHPYDGVVFGPGVDATPVVVGNSPPTGLGIEILPLDPVTGDELAANVTIAPTDPDGDLLSIEYAWAANGVPYGNPTYPSPNPAVASGVVTRGEMWSVSVRAFDAIDYGPAATIGVLIGNGGPSATGCEITPSSPFTTDRLEAMGSGFDDPEGDGEGYIYGWARLDGASWTDLGVSSVFLPAGVTEKGQTYKAICTPFDGTTEGQPVESAPVTIVNDVPTISSCEVEPLLPRTSDNITAAATGWSDTDGDPQQILYHWYRDGLVDPSVSSAVYPASQTARGQEIWVECVPYDGFDHGPPVQSNTVEVVNTEPSAPLVVINPNAPLTDDSLVAIISAGSSDDDGDTVTYNYEWRRNSVPFAAAGAVVSAGTTVRGEVWQVDVTPDDGYGQGPVGTAFVTIGNARPTLLEVRLDPVLPITIDDLLASPIGFTDPENDPAVFRYEWYVDGIPISGQSTGIFAESLTERGDTVYVVVTPGDGADWGPPVTSNTVLVINAAPSEPTIDVSPYPAGEPDDLECVFLALSTDADEDPITYDVVWFSTDGDGPIGGVSLPFANTSLGQGWWCEVTPNDGLEDGPTAVSATRFIEDLEAPPAPTIEPIYEYRNEDQVTLTGECEADCTLAFACEDATGAWTEIDTCSGLGDYATTLSLRRGDVTSCTVTCTDLSLNESDPSETVFTEVCDPYDMFEDDQGYGDDFITAIDEWTPFADDAAQFVSVDGNVVGDDQFDWYLFFTSDDEAADVAAGIDYYRFEVALTQGSSKYAMLVYSNGQTMECPSAWNDGYSDYAQASFDAGNADHVAPADPRECGGQTENHCTDFSGFYYVQVFRQQGVADSCSPYQLSVTNGVW